MKRLPLFLFSFLFAETAFAGDADDKLAGINCKEAKDLVKIMKKMTDLKPDQTDTVHGNPSMKMTAQDEIGLPDRIFFRHEDEETEFNLGDDGVVTDFKKIGTLNKNGEMCIQDKERVGNTDEEGGISINMNFHVEYKNKTGTYMIAELRDGLEDGRTHVKKLVPGPFRMMIPKFTHVKIAYEADEDETIDINPQIVALQGDVKIDGLDVEKMFDSHYVSVDQLQELGADRLGVYGGAFRMEPSASPEKMRKMVEKRQKAEAENKTD